MLLEYSNDQDKEVNVNKNCCGPCSELEFLRALAYQLACLIACLPPSLTVPLVRPRAPAPPAIITEYNCTVASTVNRYLSITS